MFSVWLSGAKRLPARGFNPSHPTLRIASVAVCLVGAILLSGCHRPAPGPPHMVSTPPAPREKATVYVVNPQAKGNDDPLIPRTVKLATPQTPVRAAVDALLTAPGSPMPKGTALRGLTLSDGVATLDFSENPVDETGGEGHQTDALTALGRTLGQFPEIKSYQIQVKGTPVTTFGEFTTDGPIPVTRAAEAKTDP